MSLRFGTDGIRGLAGAELTPELVLALGRAAARVIGVQPGLDGGSGRFLVGRDTRLSGPMLQAAFSAGVSSEGIDVVDLGVLPTPAVAAVAADRGLPAAVVSASHNPFQDNGIKLLGPGGRKLTGPEELEVERDLEQLVSGSRDALGPVSGRSVGGIAPDADALGWYCERVAGVLGARRLGGARVAVDCANGAAFETAPRILSAAGADVVRVLAATPDGTNINESCGSTDPSALRSAVTRHRAVAGLALDGDADRVIAVDETGEVVDGDRLLALFALDLQSRGLLRGSTVVVTVMTNLGFHRAMESAGIAVHQTPVGDRHVLSALEANGWSLGGEQSGHLIFRSHATTGDGVMTGLLLLDLLVRAGGSLHQMAEAAMVRLPQVLRNVEVPDLDGLEEASEVWDEVDDVERALGSSGRVLLRASGTERLVRVMVEAPTQAEADSYADHLAACVAQVLSR